ncbi:MAG: DUF1854 domain-containing protein [Verrucomicrobiales bacterium]|nr:DUF1854 domain-containing protein [Verrucomicrobiales bacterium]
MNPPSPDAPLSLVEASRIVLLDPAKVRFSQHGASLRLTLEGDCCHRQVTVLRAFPWSSPERYLSLMDGADKEIGVLVDPDSLPPEDGELLRDALRRRYFVPRVTRILAARERFGTVDWEFETDRGIRRLTTRNLGESVHRPNPGRILLTDVDGNRYDIPDLEGLDGRSQQLLLQHL